MYKKKLLIIGSGGHAKSCINVIESIKGVKIIGIIDNTKKKKLGKYKVICNLNNISKIKKMTKNLVLGVGGIKNKLIREKIFNKYKKLGFTFPILISRHSVVSKETKIDEGTIIFNHVYINIGAKIGKNCIINNKSLIEHDALIGDHCHISTGVIVNGGCKVGSGSFIGTGSVLRDNINLKKKSFIKMGTILKKDIL